MSIRQIQKLRCLVTSQDEQDRELMRRIAQHDVSAFEMLYDRHYESVLRFLARRSSPGREVEDLAQTVFLRLWEKAGVFRGDSSVSTFVKGIARNVHREALARPTLLDTAAAYPLEASLDNCPYCDQACPLDGGAVVSCRQEHELKLARAIASLPKSAREAIRLRIVEGRGAAEAARLVGCSPDTLRRRLVRAFGKLKSALDRPQSGP